MKLSEMPVLDTPQGMALLRTLNDNQAGDDEESMALPTEYLITRTMGRTRTPSTVITRVQYLKALDRLRVEQYVRSEGQGLTANWTLTKRGRRAAVEGSATAVWVPDTTQQKAVSKAV